MANISQENINTLAQVVASLDDGDYIYVCKAASGSFARIEKSLLLNAIGSNGNNVPSATVIANVNILQTKIDELISLLSNSAFGISRPNAVGQLDWGVDELPIVVYYSINISTSTMYSMTNNAITIEAGQTYTNIITANSGYTLTSVVVNGVSQTINDNQCLINISNVQSNITISISAIAESSGDATEFNISYNLTGCKVSSAVEHEGTLTVVLAKDETSWDSQFIGTQNEKWKEKYEFLARDIVVTMNGIALERKSDYTATQIDGNEDITIVINNITGDIEIMNVFWLRGCLNYNSGVETTGTTSARTNTYIPVPSTCNKIAVFGNNIENNTSLSLGCVFYNSDKQKQGGNPLQTTEVVINNLQSMSQDGHDAGVAFIRTSVKFEQSSPLSSIARIDSCYIYDASNDKFIWYGESVNRTTIRNIDRT